MKHKLLLAILVSLTFFSTAVFSQELAQRIPISSFGGWDHNRRADLNMDTNHSDPVPACCTSYLHVANNQVLLDLHFYCEEVEGDHTWFEGNKVLTLFTAPVGKQIIGLSFGNNNVRAVVRTFHGLSRGTQHGLLIFRESIAGSYWEKLQYRVDSSASDDSGRVGISGTVAFKVTLANAVARPR